MNYEKVSKNKIQFLAMTGYTVEEFDELCSHFEKNWEKYMSQYTMEGKKRKKRSYTNYKNCPLRTIEDKLFFILSYLKEGSTQQYHAGSFGMRQPVANKWIHILHTVLNMTLEELEELPQRGIHDESHPQNIDQLPENTLNSANIGDENQNSKAKKEEMTSNESNLGEKASVEATIEFSTVDGSLPIFSHDGTERPINRPKVDQKKFYSGKKKCHTVKDVLVISVICKVIFLSLTCEGKKHDKKAADEAGYAFPKGSTVYQDTGFQGFKPEGINIEQPKKKPRGKELTEEEKKTNSDISKIRIRVEHAIGGVKRYRIVSQKNRNWKKGFRDKVMETCCGLHNFRLNFRPWKPILSGN